MPNHTDKQNRYEAEEVGCSGLLGGRAKNLYTHQIIHASECRKDEGPFYCSTCFSDAVVRKCIEKRDHFAHRARLSPVIGSAEGELHFRCKTEICELLQSRFPNGGWQVERVIPADEEKGFSKLVPDISGRMLMRDGSGDEKRFPVAIEIQASTLTVPKIIRRVTSYTKRKTALLWIVPLRVNSRPYGAI